MSQPTGIPVMLEVAGRACVVVGGGSVALRRARTLCGAGADVVVIAPEIDPRLSELNATLIQRRFQASDLDHALLVVVATDNPTVNEQVQQAATADGRSVLVNRTDDADRGDLAFMVCHRDGPLTLALHTGGASAAAAVRIRDELARDLDTDWPVLLACARIARDRIQKQVPDPATRLPMLKRLTDERAVQTLKTGGKSALEALYADIIKG